MAAADRKEAVEDQPAAPEKFSSPQVSVQPAVSPAVPEGQLLPRYRAAKARMEALRADKVKSCWRQPWEELQAEFQRIYESRKNWLWRPARCSVPPRARKLWPTVPICQAITAVLWNSICP